MFPNKRLILPVAILVLAVLACNTSPATPSVSGDAVGTAAAQTVAAQLTSLAPAATAPAATVAAPTTPPSVATNTPLPAATSICDQAKFVSETVPDGTVFAPGATFTKTWRLRNTGTCTWNTSYAVVFDSGDPLGASASVALGGNVAPGQEVDLAVPMTAPGAPGNYTGYWRMRNASGVIFGTTPGNSTFWIKITVVAPTATTGLLIPHIPLGPIIPHLPLLLAPSSQQETNSVTAPAGGIGHLVVNCPSGSLVTGGGFVGSTALFVYSNSATGNGWEVDAQNTSGTDAPLNVYAICLSNSSGATSQVYSQVTAAPGGIGHVVTNCPTGTVLTGGGFAGNTSLFVYSNSATGNGWEVDAQNTSGTNQLLNSYALCLSGTSASSAQVYTQVNVAASGIGEATVACPAGAVLTGGGYAGNTSLFVYHSMQYNGWDIYAQNISGSSQLLNSYAMCTTFP